MATVTTPPKPTVNRADTDRRVRHPLQKLRGYIRTYVTIEGAAVALLFLALWFWLGLLIDYGAFRLLALDLTYEMTAAAGPATSVALRAFLLVVLVGALVALVTFKIVRRLLREFRDAALALVLQRRFPKELGDRLITAVEMADPKVAAKYGFSQAMIDQTICEAADRVEQLPVGQVFNWGRLVFHGVLVVVTTVVIYLMTLTAVCLADGQWPHHYFVRFNHTAAIWAERNLLLQDTAWPRSAHLELVRLQAGNDGEVRVPRDHTDENRPDVLVRSVKYVVADPNARPLGWRALTYKDVIDRKLVGSDVSAVKLPRNWDSWRFDLDDLPPEVPTGMIPNEWKWQDMTTGEVRADLERPAVQELLDSKRGKAVKLRETIDALLDWHTWTLDKLELQTEHPRVKDAMIDTHSGAYDQFKELFRAVREVAADPMMERTVRELVVPKTVTVLARGDKGDKQEASLKALEFNKYIYSLNGLKESSFLTVNALDFYTPRKFIKLIPPPGLDLIVADKEEPAYLYYRYLDNEAALKGKRQVLRGVSVSKGGTESTINVAAGASVTIRATADRDLRDGVRVVQPKKTEWGVLPKIPVVHLLDDRRTFEATFDHVTQKVEFDFVFRDTDGVKGIRRFILVPLDDTAAIVTDVQLPSRLRLDPKDRNRRIVTPSAVFGWKGKVSDDRGLTRLAWRYEYVEKDVEIFRDDKITIEEDTPEKRLQKAMGRVFLKFAATPVGPDFAFSEAAWLMNVVGKRAVKSDAGFKDLAQFRQLYRSNPTDDPSAEELELLLQIHPQHRKLLEQLLEVNITGGQLRELATRYRDARGDDSKLEDLAAPQQSVKRILNNVKAGSVDDLQATEKLRAFTRDVLAVLKLEDAERERFEKRVRGEPVAVLADLLALANDRADEKDRLATALTRNPERGMLKHWDLDNEADFDVSQFGLKAAKNLPQPHYELKLFAHVRDSNVERFGAPADVGPFTFLVVSQIDLEDLMMMQKVPMQALLRKAVENLEARKSGLDSEVVALKNSRPNVGATGQRLDQSLATVREAGDIARGILTECQGIVEEMELNRFEKERIGEENDKIVNPLASICETDLRKNRGSELVLTDRYLDVFKARMQKVIEKGDKDGAFWDEDIDKHTALYQELTRGLRSKVDPPSMKMREVAEDMTREGSNQVDELAKKLRKVLEALTDLQSTRDQRARLAFIVAQRRQNTLYLRQLEQRIKDRDWKELGGLK